ncbi:MAG: DUF1684 domain-containing protein [Bryobacteraceae bacterium]|nr:DUF1684 domain-containing protein [Bryobacteraceae bacterium]
MFGLVLLAALTAPTAYQSSIEQWRLEREARLKAEDGWLSLSGLFWLAEGENRIGSAVGASVQLPTGLPENAGTLVRTGNDVKFRADAATPVKVSGKEVREYDLKTDKSGHADILEIGRLRLHVIERGSKLGVRMKDPQSKARTQFTGLRWFPVKENLKIRARFVPEPKKMLFDAQAGDKQEYTSPGYVEWQYEGRSLRLTPVEEDGKLFFVLRDRTSGKSTYGAARFLYADMPEGGYVTVDFNKAYNPPCVFTPFATCPLPPPENRLQVPIEAGEKMYTGH